MLYFSYMLEYLPSKLVFADINQCDNLLPFVRQGREDFAQDLAQLGLPADYEHTSAVHAASDVETQAMILTIPSQGNPSEMTTKSYLTFGAHLIDDYFDNPKMRINPIAMFEDRRDIKKVLNAMGNIGAVGFKLAQKVLHPEAVYQGLQRMLYGGLVQNSQSEEEREMLLQEYASIGANRLNVNLAADIQKIQPSAYWATNKTVQELINAAEDEIDFNVSETWNLIYAPALYYHDIDEEKARGESSFTADEEPKLQEMINMIRIGAKYLPEFSDPKAALRLEQLKAIAESFRQVLPKEIYQEYEMILKKQA